nr:retrotransposon protein, putative, unclassified [Tanacetum cinerariifolium]
TDLQHYLFACFLSQVEPRSVAQAPEDPSWVDAMQEEMQQFKFQNVWVLVDLPTCKYAIGTKSILKNKQDARGIIVRNKVRLVAQVKALYGLHQALRAWYATISTFLLKHGYRRGTINKTLFLKKNNRDIILVQVYVDGIIFGSIKKAWCDEFKALMKGEFQMSDMGELTFFLGLQVQQ